MKKAFDRMWRDGLFYKLKDKIEILLWRAIYNYYKTSKGKVKLDNEISNEFNIQEGVKQGGILLPYLFNYFMNELLNENEINGYGAKIGRYNVSLISYCDDLIILSPSVIHADKILKVCEDYANNWKLILNVNKCNWYIHGISLVKTPNFMINDQLLENVSNIIHLGLPIGNQQHIEDFFNAKFRKVERSHYSLYSLGCNKNGLNFFLISNIYKKFSQPIFYYGLETTI